MEIIKLSKNPDNALADKLRQFEKQFRYPLSSDAYFTIDHGARYINFYQAMGKAFSLIALSDDEVIGVLSCAMRTLQSNSKQYPVAYLGDLKVHPDFHGKGIVYQIAKSFQEMIEDLTIPIIGIVMEGTKPTPDQYSGKFGLPKLNRANDIVILQIQTKASNLQATQIIPDDAGLKLFQQLNQHAAFLEQNPLLRCKGQAQWFTKNDQACALLENTLLAKRLTLHDGHEILNAHISNFTYQDPSAACQLINDMGGVAHQLGMQAMFLALDEASFSELEPSLIEHQITFSISHASIYSTHRWEQQTFNINTSEI